MHQSCVDTFRTDGGQLLFVQLDPPPKFSITFDGAPDSSRKFPPRSRPQPSQQIWRDITSSNSYAEVVADHQKPAKRTEGRDSRHAEESRPEKETKEDLPNRMSRPKLVSPSMAFPGRACQTYCYSSGRESDSNPFPDEGYRAEDGFVSGVGGWGRLRRPGSTIVEGHVSGCGLHLSCS